MGRVYMNNSFRGSIVANDVTLTCSSAYDDDYLIIQQGTNCIVLDVTDDIIKLDIHDLLMSLEFRNTKPMGEI